MKSFSYTLFKVVDFFEKKTDCINNLKSKVILYKENNEVIITTVVDKIIEGNSYVVSPYNLIINYSKDELYKIKSNFYKFVATEIINLLDKLLKQIEIDKIQILNNYMLSTNFFSSYWENKINLKELKNISLNKFPNHSLLIRSINKFQNPLLYEKLLKENFVPIISRQIYIISEWNDAVKKRDYINDQKHFNKSKIKYSFQTLKSNDLTLYKEAERLYNLLYLDKYSINNIQFKAKYLMFLDNQNLIHLRLLKDNITNEFVGVVGLMGENNVLTIPFIGYDTSYSSKEGLYRLIMFYAINYAKEENYVLNLSSGAPEFKKFRGAKPYIEYMFCYVENLSFFKRFVWKLLSFISLKFYKKVLTKFNL